MLIDTHCHLNMMVKTEFDTPLTAQELALAGRLIDEAAAQDVNIIINVGTSLIESKNCVQLARHYTKVFATVGLHPNDCTPEWQKDFKEIKCLVQNKEANKIVGIGECGLDRHYKEYDINRQTDAFKAQIELALEHNLALVIHSRDAADETLTVLDEYRGQLTKATMHCFSYDEAIAQDAIGLGCVLGIGGTITYPKNETLRTVVRSVALKDIVLETDAPFLPPQIISGKQNHPLYIRTIAEYIAKLRDETFEQVALQTTTNAQQLFGI